MITPVALVTIPTSKAPEEQQKLVPYPDVRRTIPVARGIGRGPTTLAAFDAALRAAGIANFNLLRLSSVIPPGSQVRTLREGERCHLEGGWGDRLYVVIAEQRVSEPGVEAWAGIGWVQQADTLKGLFVEHEGNGEDSVRGDITDSLRSLVEGRDELFGPPQMTVVGVRCDGEPACAMVVAIFDSEPWGNQNHVIHLP